ncbi:uncharacterized protein LOC114271857 isoform X3 [Camellia sinensis]|uniref:uncharacterized protein LOC114271857 isoform X3 n=1 Tax=Camellia sinensis TaxID=4442 RepID=UPI001036D207|nr:uncharacterized protein LOC114271857 isoform X3 [Camellia sinensis]
MDATKKQLTKPSTATKKVTNYEKQRMKTINENRERMNALGVKNITTCLKATVQHKKLRKEKQIPIEENDDDYRPSEAEDGSDTETYDSFEHELLEIPSRARSQSHHEALTHALEEGDTSSRPEVTAGNTIDWIGVAFLTCNNDVICLNVHFCLIRIHILFGVTLVIIGFLVELNKL